MGKNDLNFNEQDYPGSPADPQVLPVSTYWPLVMAFGLLLLLWGIITSAIVIAVGAICMAVALTGWIIELNYE
jgi:hypothetical protein